MNIDKNWWKKFFDDVYLITDARSVCDNKVTAREVDIVEKMLCLRKDDKILDLCGGYGRHSLELARRGYRNISVLDYSGYLIAMGRRMAKKAGLPIRFYRSDARATKLADKEFTVITVMANSFGYSPRDSDNIRILKEANRILADNGRLVLDLADPEYIREHLMPLSWHEAQKNIIVCRERKLTKGLIKAREMVISKKDGLIRDRAYCGRLYGKRRIKALLRRARFKNIAITKKGALHKKKKDYGLLSSRMFVACRKI